MPAKKTPDQLQRDINEALTWRNKEIARFRDPAARLAFFEFLRQRLRDEGLSSAYIKEFLGRFERENAKGGGQYAIYDVSSEDFERIQVAADEVRGVELDRARNSLANPSQTWWQRLAR